jgi:hypothetical protein
VVPGGSAPAILKYRQRQGNPVFYADASLSAFYWPIRTAAPNVFIGLMIDFLQTFGIGLHLPGTSILWLKGMALKEEL